MRKDINEVEETRDYELKDGETLDDLLYELSPEDEEEISKLLQGMGAIDEAGNPVEGFSFLRFPASEINKMLDRWGTMPESLRLGILMRAFK